MPNTIRPNTPIRRGYALKEGLVRVGPLTNLPALLCELGCDPGPIFTKAGFDLDQFADPNVEIPFSPASTLFANCVSATGCGHLGLLLGQRTDPSLLGIAGFMLRTAKDVGTALRGLVHFIELHDRGAVVTLNSNERDTLLGYAIILSEVEATDQVYDLAMTITCRIMRSLCGGGWNPTEVLLSRQPPKNIAPYRRFFRAPLRFNADQTAMRFPTPWLYHPIASADPLLHHHLEKEANELYAQQKSSIVASLHRLLRKSKSIQKGSAADMARLLGMHERTLNRRLKEAGTTFHQERDKIRYDLARQLLADDTLAVSKIASALNYADTTAFSRAFKRWSGVAPTEWRTRHQSEMN